jgi:MATE family multidrug resistance protein
MIGANIVNIILNYAFVYGHFGFEPMGLTGSGWATFCSRIFMAIGIALYVFYHRELRNYRMVFSLGSYSKNLFSTMLHLGVPSGIQFIFEVAAFDFSLVMMGWLGTQTQAAHQIAINLATLSYMTTAGLAAAATVRVGYFSGQKDLANVRKAAYSLLGMASALMCLWAIVFVTARFQLPTLYVEDQQVIPIAASLLVIAGLFQLSDGVQVVCVSALRGLQDVKIPSLFILAAYWAVGLPLGYLLAFKLNMGGQGIWWGLFIGLTITALAMFLRLRKFLNVSISSTVPEAVA